MMTKLWIELTPQTPRSGHSLADLVDDLTGNLFNLLIYHKAKNGGKQSVFKPLIWNNNAIAWGEDILKVTSTQYCKYWSSTWSVQPPHRPDHINTISTHYLTNLYLFNFQNIRLISSELWTFNNHKYYCFSFIATAEIPGMLLMGRPWPYLLHHLCTLENPIIETLHVDSPFFSWCIVISQG